MSSKASNFGKSSFGQTLHFITDVKLAELEKQRLAYESHSKVLEEAKRLGLSNSKDDILNQVRILSKAVSSWRGSGAVNPSSIIGGKLTLSDLNFWLEQAVYDPCFNLDVARGWAATLEEHIRHDLMRFNSARLFGKLFNEWIASGDSSTLVYQPGPDDSAADSDDTMSFEHVELEKNEIRDHREKLEAIIFEDYPIDVEKLKAYMEGLFTSSEDTTAALATLRGHMSHFGRTFGRRVISESDVQYAIQGLLASGLMDEEKREALKAFQEKPTIMTEIVSVLNMRMSSLSSWAWPEEGTLVEFRRHLNGKYRPFTDPEIVDALLLHYIGVSWQVQLKSCLVQLFEGKAWVRPAEPTLLEKQKRDEQLADGGNSQSIDMERKDACRDFFLLSQLHDAASKPSNYDDLVDAPEVTDQDKPSPAVIKRKLLHIMTTECYLNHWTLHGSHAILRSDMEMFGPSLPHDTILAVLEFIGIPKQWIDFFKTFLAAPLLFPGDTTPRVRKRGTPISYALSILFGEAVLFIMDFAVNQSGGLHLYRMHDDLWLWDSEAKKVVGAWSEMNKYADLAGLRFNKKKTGSSFVGPRTEDHVLLPDGDIRWGFLKFDAGASRFIIDQNEVDAHILDMRRQLSSTKSVFGWINAYNKYTAFFLRNFGGVPANCFNKEHFMDLVNTLGRIQLELVPKDSVGAVGAIGHLRRTLDKRFGITDLPDGYFYFPVEHGGLGLRNRVLELLSLEKHGAPMSTWKEVRSSEGESGDDDAEMSDSDSGKGDYSSENLTPGGKFEDQVKLDRKGYNWLKKNWDDNAETRLARSKEPKTEFMSFDEYIALRESRLYSWVVIYRDMLDSPEPRLVAFVPKIREALEESKWKPSDWYEKWIVSMYGGEIIEIFGKLEVVDRSLIPIGMVELFQTSRMKLD